MRKFIINEEEKSRILSLHTNATKRQYLGEQEDASSGGFEHNGTVYKKPGIKDIDTLQRYLQIGNELSVLEMLNNYKLQSTKKPTGSELERMLPVWRAGVNNKNTGFNISPNSKSPIKTYATTLRHMVSGILSYAAETGVSGQQYKSNPKGFASWDGSSTYEDPLEFVSVYPNIVQVMGDIIGARDSMLQS